MSSGKVKVSQQQPDIEHSLDGTTERHEALAQSVELHRAESQQFQRTMAAVIESLHQSNRALPSAAKAPEVVRHGLAVARRHGA